MTLRMCVTIAIAGAVAPIAAQEIGVQVREGQVTTILAEKIALEGQHRMAVEARFTAGAPYSAEAINESLQVLADGNRIAKKTVTRIYRDSEGRTRREIIGSDGQAESISIGDPVAGTTYVLDPKTKVASRNGFVMVAPSGVSFATYPADTSGVRVASKVVDGVATVEVKEDKQAAEVRARAGGSGAATTFSGSVSAGARGGGGFGIVSPLMLPSAGVGMGVGKTSKEDLGQQVVEGVTATGSRSTTVIEAGAIGNEQPIQIVSEQWTSTDLKLLVLTKHSDPRSGESTYRLTNITQTEQPRSLFELPADYTLKESVIRRKDQQN